MKASAGLLAGIGVASLLAHKFWPKGVLYGGKEEWETRVVDKKRTQKVVERDPDGRLRGMRSVETRGDGDVVVSEVRRGRDGGERMRRYAANGPPHRERSMHDHRRDLSHPRQPERYQREDFLGPPSRPRRPVSVSYEDERRPMDRREEPRFVHERYPPRRREQYLQEDSRYEDSRYEEPRFRERAYRSKDGGREYREEPDYVIERRERPQNSL